MYLYDDYTNKQTNKYVTHYYNEIERHHICAKERKMRRARAKDRGNGKIFIIIYIRIKLLRFFFFLHAQDERFSVFIMGNLF